MQSLLRRIGRRWTGFKWSVVRSIRDTVTVRTRQGLLTVSTRDEVIGKLLYQQGHYQHDLACRVMTFLRQRGLLPDRGRGVVLDVGCNIGLISIGLLFDGEFEAAVGIEPEPYNFALCQRNVVQNGFHDRYTALQVAASDSDGVLEFGLSRHNFGDHRVHPSGAGGPIRSVGVDANREVITVPASTIDAILDRLPSAASEAIALVWIDVQGHEGFVFRGGPRLFSRRVPVVAEVWPLGLNQSGMGVPRFCEIAATYWSHFWAWRRCGRYVRYPISDLSKFCEELGDGGEFDDVVFAHAEPAAAPGPAGL